ncbi:MAG: DUF362 domain-containing protein [Candidatus Eisenbacteria sp.]|nr:DUF362 domain-containing protein [Candidatus Eisenbacteria bacterium]
MQDGRNGWGSLGEAPSRSRRDFLKASALAAAAAAAGPSIAGRRLRSGIAAATERRENTMPGRIVIFHDPVIGGHLGEINKDRVEGTVHHGVRILAGIDDTATAFELLFPGLHSGSTFAIKVNCIGPTDTRWEAVRGVVSGLSLMLGGTYDVSQVIIYDPHNLHSHGYQEDEFTFNGNYPLISHTANCSSSYYVYGNHRLSNYLLDCDYVINFPALKSHSNGNNQITVAMKNHYGSCCSQGLCGNITGMLTVNSDPNVGPKTCLVVTDGIRGTYNGGPGEPPQTWNTFAEGTPNTLLLTTDPVTNEYWARDMINAERDSHGWSPKPCPWIEEASGDPWYLGISDPEQMTVIYHDVSFSDVSDDAGISVGASFFVPNVPNPFTQATTLRFRLGKPGPATLLIADASGRILRRLARREFPAGYCEVRWDGRDDKGKQAPSGTYFARLETAGAVRTRPILLAR